MEKELQNSSNVYQYALSKPLDNEYTYLNRLRGRDANLNEFSNELAKHSNRSSILPKLSKNKNKSIERIEKTINTIREQLSKNHSSLQPLSENRNHHLPVNFPGMQMPMQYSHHIPMQMPPMQMPPMPPIQIPIPMPMPMPYPFSYQCSDCDCGRKSSKKPKKKKSKKKKNKSDEESEENEKKTIKKRSMRIYGYAVYFSIFIKHYSKRFTQNRRKWFNDRYIANSKSIIHKGSEKISSRFYQIDLYAIIKNAKSAYSSKQQSNYDWESLTKTALVPNKKNLKLNRSHADFIIRVVESLLEKIEQIFSDQSFLAEYHEVLSVGSLNQSFLISNLYIPKEIPFVNIHPEKGYLRASFQEEIQMLNIKIMIKIVIYNYLLGIKRSKMWNSKTQKAYQLETEQIEQIWQIARVVAIYLYIICQDIYSLGISNLKYSSNFNEYAKKFGIKAAKILDDEQMQIKVQNKDPNPLIQNLYKYQEVLTIVANNSRLRDYKDTIMDKLIEILTNLHKKLKQEQKQLYIYIKEMTLEIPFIIFGSSSKGSAKKNNQNYQLQKPKTNRKGLENDSNSKTFTHTESSASAKKSKQQVMFALDDELDGGEEVSHAKEKENISENRIMSKNIERLSTDKLNIRSSVGPPRKNEIIKNPLNSLYFDNAESKNQPFKLDTINERNSLNRQDRLRQKFKNILMRAPH